MKITMEDIEVVPVDTPKSGKKQKAPRKAKAGKMTRQEKKDAKKNSKGKQEKRSIIGVPTNKRDKLVDSGLMRRHNFLSITTPMLTKIIKMNRIDDRSNKFEAESEPHHVSAIMKMILSTMQTNELSNEWSIILWNITQQDGILPEGCSVTFTRAFERKDDVVARKKIARRRRLSILSSSSGDNVKRQSIAASHDNNLINAIDSGDSIVSFGAEAIVTAPDEQILEIAVDAVKNYLTANDETRGIRYELDINKQSRPFINYGANDSSGNKDVITDMTSFDAGLSALFVDSGGDRTMGSEYLGVSVGKLIRSHAAYNFQNHTSLYVGNDTTGETATIGGVIAEPSQVYLSKVASRSYLLTGHKVTHFVADDANAVKQLMDFPINAERKSVVDVSKGLLNLLEAIDDGTLAEHPDRILSRFPTHINNIITLLSQFRDTDKISVTDDFANLARDILIDFFVANKYWSYDARYDITDIRLVGVAHKQFKKLSDFGQYIEQRKRSNKDASLKNALAELDTIVNRNILPTIPALDTKTDDLIDVLVKAQYRVVDLTGMSVGAVGNTVNPSMNVMMISYLNLMLPSMSNGDVIVLHGISYLSSIARVIKDMITSSGLNLDVIYTEKNQNAAIRMRSNTSDLIEEEDDTTHKMHKVTRAMPLDFVMIDLYNNRSDKLVEQFDMDKDWVTTLSQTPAAFFIKTDNGLDYIYLDKIL